MRQNRKNATQEMISIEEYLKKRQAVRAMEAKPAKGENHLAAEWSTAMELAEMMYM